MDKTELISINDLVKIFGIKKSWVRKHLYEIPHFKIHRLVRFNPKEVRDWLKRFSKGDQV